MDRQPPPADETQAPTGRQRRVGTASDRLPFRLIATGLLLLIAAAAAFSYGHAERLDTRIAQFDAARGAVERGRALLATAREIEWRRGTLNSDTPRDDLQAYAQTLDNLQPQIVSLRENSDVAGELSPLLTRISRILEQQQSGITQVLNTHLAPTGLPQLLPTAPVSILRVSAEQIVDILNHANDAQRVAVTTMVQERTLATYVTLALLATLSILAMVLGSRHFDALRLHEELRLQVRETRRESDEKSSFLALVSHEIRTPMNAIFGFAGLLRDRLRDPADRRYVDAITEGARALLTMINDLLDLSRIEAGRLELQRAPVHLRDVIDSVVALFARQAQDKGLQLIAQSPDAMPTLLLDADRVRQMIINLVSNALKHTEHGSIRIVVELPPQAVGNRFDVNISVADTGIGIDAREIEQIFEPFVQGRREDTGRRARGTGLGLSITRQLARMMGGDVSVRSQPDAGSCFRIDLPSVAVASQEREALRTAAGAPPAVVALRDGQADDPPAGDADDGRSFPGPLLDELQLLQRELWPSLNETLTMSEVRGFAADVESLAEQGEWPSLALYARQLGRGAADFDVAAVETLLADYPARIAALRRDVSPNVREAVVHAR